MTNKILFIVEGKKTEPKILKKLLNKLEQNNTHIYPYQTNIYNLFQKLENDFGSSYEDVDLIAFLQELEKEKSKKYPQKTIDNIVNYNRRDFSEIYLFFDSDTHNSDKTLQNFKKIKKLISMFDEETHLGKIFISYPMVESLYLYNPIQNSTVQFCTFKANTQKSQSGKGFKEIVNSDKRNSTSNKFSTNNLERIKEYHLLLSHHLLGFTPIDFCNYEKEVSTATIFQKQFDCFQNSGFIFIYSGIAEFIMHYSKEKDFPKQITCDSIKIEYRNLWADSKKVKNPNSNESIRLNNITSLFFRLFVKLCGILKN